MTESSGIQVLHVDDESDLVELAADMLEREDSRFSVETATSASDGLDRLTADDFDCIISDYQMPGQNGIEFLETVREENPDLPFILYTAKGDEEVASEAISAGVTDYFQKGARTGDFTLLTNRIVNAVESHQHEKELNQFKSAAEHAGHAVYITDTDGTINYANPPFEEITGYSAEEVQGENLRILKSGEMADEYYSQLWDSITAGETWEKEVVNRRKNGELYHADQTIAPILDENDDIEAFVAIQSDITDREEERERLKFLETLENELIELSTDFLRTEGRDIDTLIDDALETLGRLVEADRSYIFEVDHNAETLTNTYEWCGEGIEPQIDMLQELPLDTFPWWMQKLEQFENVTIPDVSKLPAEAEVLQEILQEQNIESLIVTPMISDDKLVGFIGFDWVEEQDAWSQELIDILRLASEIITTTRTERRRERQIQQLKERFELAVNGAELGVWDWDMTTDEVDFNEQWAAMLGYSLDEVESHLTAWEKRVHPDDLEAVRDALDAHIEGETDYYDTEHRMQTADNDWKWIRDVGKIFERDDDGEPTRAVGIHIDISDRKGHEQQLQALHGANRRLINADSRAEVADIAVKAARNLLDFPVPSMWYATDSKIELVANSEKHQNLLDEAGTTDPTYPPDSWLGDIIQSGETTIKSPLPPEDLAADVPLRSAILLPLGEVGVLACAAKGEVEFTERQVQIAEILAQNVEVALNQLDQKRALERQQQFTDDLLDTIEDVVYVLDTNGDLIEWNRALEEVSGYSGDQLESTNALDLFSDDDEEAIADAVQQAFETGRTRVESDILTADGESIPYEFVAKSFENPDGELMVAGLGRDRSLHVEYERTLEEQRNNLEVLNQVVRHDIRNDMNVVQGRSELLEDHIDEAGQEHLESLLGATKSAVELTTTARDLAETMLSSQEDVEPVRLDDHLRGSIENARSEFQDAAISIEKIPDVRVHGNDLLEAVFRNLIHNAIVHNDKQTPKVQISTTVDTETSWVAVADNGPGIPDDQKEMIFGKGETRLDSPGTGIGLYLVQTLVEQYGGEVWVEDNDPEGSVFVVELPIAE